MWGLTNQESYSYFYSFLFCCLFVVVFCSQEMLKALCLLLLYEELSKILRSYCEFVFFCFYYFFFFSFCLFVLKSGCIGSTFRCLYGIYVLGAVELMLWYIFSLCTGSVQIRSLRSVNVIKFFRLLYQVV